MSAKRAATPIPQVFIATILLLAGLAAAAVMPAKAWAASGYNLWLAGTQITDDSPADIFGDGTALYDARARKLTLENFVATGEDSGTIGGMLYASRTDLTLVIKGENALVGGDGGGIYVEDNLTITGDGTLTVSSGNCPSTTSNAGIHANKVLTIDEGFTGTLVATGGSALRDSCGIECTSFVMNGGTVIATGGTAETSAGVSVEQSSTVNGGILCAQGGNSTQFYSAGIYGNTYGGGYLHPTVAINGGVLVARAGLRNGSLGSYCRGAFWNADYTLGENMKIVGEVGYDGGVFYGRSEHGTAGDPPVGMVFVPESWRNINADILGSLAANVYSVSTRNDSGIAEIGELDTKGYTALFVRLYEDSSIGGTALQFSNSVKISGTGTLIGIGGNCPGNSYSMGLSFQSSLTLNDATLIGVSASCESGDAIGVSVEGSATITDGTMIGVGGTSSQTSTGVSFGSTTKTGGASTVVGVGGTATKTSAGVNWPYWNKFTLEGTASMLAAGGLSSSSNSYGVGQTCYEYVPEIGAGTRLAALGGCAPTGTSMGISTSTSYRGGSYTLNQGCNVATLGGVGAYSYGSSANFYDKTLYGNMVVAGRTRAFYRDGDTYNDEISIGSECSFTGYADYAGTGDGTAIANGSKFGSLVGYKRIVLHRVVKYPLWIAGTQVDENNIGKLANLDGVTVAQDGYLRFDPATGTLSMKNAEIKTAKTGDADQYNCGIYAKFDLTLDVSGTNSVTGVASGFWRTCGIFVDGYDLETSRYNCLAINLADGAKLTCRGGSSYGESRGILVNYPSESTDYYLMTVTGNGTLDAASGAIGNSVSWSYGYGITAGSYLQSDNPTVMATVPESHSGAYGMYVVRDLVVSGGSLTANAGDASYTSYGVFKGQNGNTAISGGTLTAKAGKAPSESYGIYWQGNYDAITGGTVVASTSATEGTHSALMRAPSTMSVSSAIASVNSDGSEPVEYVAADNATYNWFKAPAKVYTVTVVPGEGSFKTSEYSVSEGCKMSLPAPTSGAPQCKEFDRWDVAAADEPFVVTSDMTVTALWKDAHKLTKVAAVPATCEKDGNTAHWKCSVCGKLFADAAGKKEVTEQSIVDAATGHKWDEGKVTVEPTVGAEGVKTFTCQNDKTHTRTEPIAKVDATSVKELAEQAEAAVKGVAVSEDGSDVSPDAMWVTPAAKKALDDAVEAAKKVAADPASTQADVDAAKKAVADAQAAFEAAKKPGKPVPPEPGETLWTRLAGDSAFETMNAIIDEGNFAAGGTVVLASLEGYWDALTAAGVAGLEQAPVVMSLPEGLSPEASAQLARLAPKKIVVCGGTYWLPDALLAEAAAAAGTSPEVVRLAGDNAALTAGQIAAYGKGKWSETAIVATAGTFQDALAAAPVSYAKGMPIFLAQFDFATETGFITKETIASMKNAGIKQAYIAGGTYWLPAQVKSDLEKAGIKVLGQLGGASAVETSGLIAELACGTYGMNADKMGAANVAQHYDALASAAFCGQNNSVLVLVSDTNRSVVDSFVKPNASKIAQGYIFGGTGSVSDASKAALEAATK